MPGAVAVIQGLGKGCQTVRFGKVSSAPTQRGTLKSEEAAPKSGYLLVTPRLLFGHLLAVQVTASGPLATALAYRTAQREIGRKARTIG